VIALSLPSFVFYPTFIRFSNPPFHRFGGFDIPWWSKGVALYVVELAVITALARSRVGIRRVTLTLQVVLVLILVAMLWQLGMALNKPTL